MNIKNNSWRSARNICIVTTLAKLGHYPTKTTEKEAWFLSPLRSETQASFSVSLSKNLWYDYGIGEGGNNIDLIMALKQCSFKEAMQYLLNEYSSFSFCPPSSSENMNDYQSKNILKIIPITHPGLIVYLQERKIPLAVAKTYCKEVHYLFNKKRYFSVGLRNNLEGWELRNRYCKNSISPKSYTHISNSSSTLLITEGIFDFLSLAAIEKELVEASDSMVLNSLAFIEKIDSLLPEYKQVLLYLDNDPAGIEAAKKLLNLYPNITDKGDSYKPYKDLNEKLKNESP